MTFRKFPEYERDERSCENPARTERYSLILQHDFFVLNRTVHNYIIWRVLKELTAHLVDQFQEKKIEFRQVLMGVTSERSRWRQCVEWTNQNVGMALGLMFIRDNFDPKAKVCFLF